MSQNKIKISEKYKRDFEKILKFFVKNIEKFSKIFEKFFQKIFAKSFFPGWGTM